MPKYIQKQLEGRLWIQVEDTFGLHAASEAPRWEELLDLTTLPASWEICMQVKKQQLELDMEQQTGSKSGKEYVKAMLSPCSFNLRAEYLMRNAGLDEAQAGIKIAGRNINNLRHRWHHPYGRKWRGTQKPLDESEKWRVKKLA